MLARKLEYYPEEQVQAKEQRKKRIEQAKKAQKKNNSLIKMFFLTIPVLITGVCIFILFRYVNITQVRQEITSLEIEKVELEKTKINLIGDLESMKSSPMIAEQAKYKLGMDYPTKDQIVYIGIGDSQGESLAEEKNNALDLIMAKIGNLF